MNQIITPEYLVWGLSALASVIFFAAGYLARSMMARWIVGAPLPATSSPVRPSEAPTLVPEEPGRPTESASTEPTAGPEAPPPQELLAGIPEALKELVEMDQVSGAVVTDSRGNLIGGAGDPSVHEPLAVVSGSLVRTTEDARKAMPITEEMVLQFKDHGEVVVAQRYFKYEGALYAISTLGNELPPGEWALESAVTMLTGEE
jgi:hypothetical protein